MNSNQPSIWGFKRRAWPLIKLVGKDSLDFLQRLSTQNVLTMKVGDVAPTAFLNGNGTVIGLCLLWKKSDHVILLPEPQSSPSILQHLHKMHFSEEVEIQEEKTTWIEIRGIKARDFLKQKLNADFEAKNIWPVQAHENERVIVPAEPWGTAGWLLQSEDFPVGVTPLTEEEYYTERALHLFPRDQIDIGEANIILESGLLDYVHRNKGCYPGQEVVERIFTYGNVAKKLILLEANARELERGSELYTNEKKIGNVTSRHSISKSGSYFYVATVFRMQAIVGNVFSLGAGQTPQLKVLKVAGTD